MSVTSLADCVYITVWVQQESSLSGKKKKKTENVLSAFNTQDFIEHTVWGQTDCQGHVTAEGNGSLVYY